jgi:hypothetical protein
MRFADTSELGGNREGGHVDIHKDWSDAAAAVLGGKDVHQPLLRRTPILGSFPGHDPDLAGIEVGEWFVGAFIYGVRQGGTLGDGWELLPDELVAVESRVVYLAADERRGSAEGEVYGVEEGASVLRRGLVDDAAACAGGRGAPGALIHLELLDG